MIFRRGKSIPPRPPAKPSNPRPRPATQTPKPNTPRRPR